MKKKFLLVASVLMATVAFVACDKDDEVLDGKSDAIQEESQSSSEQNAQLPVGEFLLSSECLGSPYEEGGASLKSAGGLKSESAHFSYNESSSILSIGLISHIANCSGEHKQSIKVVGDTIKVHSFSENISAKCDCIYNLNSQVSNIKPGVYYVYFTTDDNASTPSLLRLDLTSIPQDGITYILDGQEHEDGIQSIYMGVSKCKNSMSSARLKSYRESSVAYTYDADKLELTLVTMNVMLTCGSNLSMTQKYILSGDTLNMVFTIDPEKYDPDAPQADCVCPYDFTSKVIGIKPGVYKVNDAMLPYAYDEPIDLTQSNEGVIYFR